METAVNEQIINTMVSQLGGRRFMIMTGAKPLYKEVHTSNPAVMFRIPLKNGKKNFFNLQYDSGMDLYNMKFLSQRGIGPVKVDKEFTGIYGDQLQSIFTEVTGLYTQL